MAGTIVVVVALVLGLSMTGDHGMLGVEGLVCSKAYKDQGCNKTISDLFTEGMFEGMFMHRNGRMAHAQGFWSYGGFMTAAKMFQSAGFGSVGGDDTQKKELAAFFAHVAHETSCGWPGAKDSPYAWGLCYNRELSPTYEYCKGDELLYPCAPGASYHGRGAFPLYWNFNYGATGAALKQDLLNHPEILSYNETVAWQAAIWYWMTPGKTRPSPHQVMVGKWVPTKNDTLAKRLPGFGMTINIRASESECGHGDDLQMHDRIGHYVRFLHDYFGLTDPGVIFWQHKHNL
ncbi:chitinase-like protein 1 isoform X2 [Physcomitrium patens]|uniref:chitinase-like protein 1 isoform X2 n=1 Tax=Physcomitrium patens TaxID=3218 RepID=UPI003CCCCEE1